jgi:hypothetical protein
VPNRVSFRQREEVTEIKSGPTATDFKALTEAMERAGGPNALSSTAVERQAHRLKVEDDARAWKEAHRAAKLDAVHAGLARYAERKALTDAGMPYSDD